MFDCDLIKGEVVMGVHPALPVEGIVVILGNCHYTSCYIFTFLIQENLMSLQTLSEVFAVCAVKRVLSQAEVAFTPEYSARGR